MLPVIARIKGLKHFHDWARIPLFGENKKVPWLL